MAAPVIIVLGPQGSGKGTQCAILANEIGGVHLSSGQLLRDSDNQDLQDRMAKGELVRSEDFFMVIDEALRDSDPNKIIVFDGVGRMIEEAKWLMDVLKKHHRELKRVVLLNVPRAVSVERFSKRKFVGSRRDDLEGGIEKRLDLYEKETLPVIDYYQQKDVLVEVDGTGSIEEVAQSIKRALQ